MPYYIQLESSERLKLFNKLKKRFGQSWDKIYPNFKISRAMFFQYLSGNYDIPENIFLQLEKLSGFYAVNLQKIYKTKYIKKEIINPKMSVELAEILGVINGDGHLGKNGQEISITGNALEKDYFDYLKVLFERTFNLEFRLFMTTSTVLKLKIYSTELSKILNKEFNLPLGKKKGRLYIPKQVFSSDNFLISYIRGLFDTDGTIYIRRKKDMVIEIISADPNYLIQIKKALVRLNFRTGISGKHLYIYNQEEIVRFFGVIKPANPKHLKKLDFCLNLKRR